MPAASPLEPAELDIGICIPVLNERAALGALLDDLSRTLADARYTVCIVDDGSTDGTRELVEARASVDPRIVLLKRQKTKPGCRRGAASRAGMEWLLDHTSHALLTDVDADGANRPCELLGAARVAADQHADVVIASKYVAGSVVQGRPLGRRLGSRVYNLVLRLLLAPRIRDFSNSFRIYRREAAVVLRRFEPRHDTPTYLIEMLAIWLAQGLRIVEMPTTYVERRTGSSKVIATDALRGAAGALRVGWLYRSGAFRGVAS